MNAESGYAPGDVLHGKFAIVRELGRGGMGAVYEVQHVLTHHRRALKVLRIDKAKNREGTVRLLREASAAGRIGNPHIVETFDAGTLENGDPYIVMELLQGESFTALMSRRGTMRVGEVAALVRQACTGLQAAHDAGIVHRDVKPANLFVVPRDGRLFVKVLDFGVSKFDTGLTDSTELTRDGALIGTPTYMAPEQLRGRDVDARIDIYALGVLLYVMLTGHRPYVGTSLADLAIKVDRGEHRALRELRPDVPPEVEAIVERAMHPDREQRYPTLLELWAQLAPFDSDLGEEEQPATTQVPRVGGTRPSLPMPAASGSDVDSNARMDQPANPWSHASGRSSEAPAVSPPPSLQDSVTRAVPSRPTLTAVPRSAPLAEGEGHVSPALDESRAIEVEIDAPVVVDQRGRGRVLGVALLAALGAAALWVVVGQRGASPEPPSAAAATASSVSTGSTMSSAAPAAEAEPDASAASPSPSVAFPAAPAAATATAAATAAGNARGTGVRHSTSKPPLERRNPY
jgi:serine/threonine-protein kinase